MYRLLINTLLVISSALAADLIVDLPDGRIRGSEISNDNKTYYAYRGIPFATPPLGKLRFMPPVPPQPWDGILETNETKACCIPVTAEVVPEQSEDCLYLNVYTPARKITKKLPVMLLIMGGGFITGCTSDEGSGPFYLVDEDVIVVYFNYRLGHYGFLSTQDNVVLGNAGLKDQLLAMKWVKNNIALFGGDPDKITIFGGSAGGVSVGIHILNPKSAGLYRAAVCQSGCSLANITELDQTDARKAAYDYAKFIDPTISEKNTTTEIRDFLQSQPADIITAAYSAHPSPGLVIEVEDEEAYLTELTFPVLESGNFNRVPLIIGTTSAEALTFFGILGGLPLIQLFGESYDADVTSLIPTTLVLLPGTNATEVGNIIKEAYVGKNGSFSENLAAVVEFSSDVKFPKSTIKQAEIQSKYTPVYLYQLSFEAEAENQFHPILEGAGKVGHGEDAFYLFNSIPLLTEREIRISKQIVRLWTNFAKTMNPTPDEFDPLLNITWSPVTPTNIQFLDLDDTLALKPDQRAEKTAMWNHVYYTYGQQPFGGF